jgi:DNA-binding HxlR family transcriptional regulator
MRWASISVDGRAGRRLPQPTEMGHGSSRPHDVMWSGWIRIRDVAPAIGSALPRTSTPLGCQGASTSSMTIATRSWRTRSRNFFVDVRSRPPTSMTRSWSSSATRWARRVACRQHRRWRCGQDVARPVPGVADRCVREPRRVGHAGTHGGGVTGIDGRRVVLGQGPRPHSERLAGHWIRCRRCLVRGPHGTAPFGYLRNSKHCCASEVKAHCTASEFEAPPEGKILAKTPRPGQPVRGSTAGRPLMAALDLLGRRWALRIVWELRDEAIGFRQLQERCDRMSSSVLRDRLAELAEAHLVHRRDDEKYEVTPTGRELVSAIGPLSEWARRWARQMKR